MSNYSDQFPNIWSALSARDAADRQNKLEEKLRRWAKAPSDSEIEKCERAVRMVKAAIAADKKLSGLNIEVYAKGSFANRTNIPSDSDVDVAVVHKNLFFNDYPEGVDGDSKFGFENANYTYSDFKRDVAYAIVNYFGTAEVTVGNKAIQVHSNSSRVDADVVPHTIHRRYLAEGGYHEGVALVTSTGTKIKNWPQHDYDNGVSKNERTKKRYKALVRVIKNLRCEMSEKGIKSAEKAPSYLIACLVWNLQDHHFDEDSYVKLVEDALAYLIERTSDANNVREWGEVNELKYLFRRSQGWKLDEVHDFLVDSLTHVRGQK